MSMQPPMEEAPAALHAALDFLTGRGSAGLAGAERPPAWARQAGVQALGLARRTVLGRPTRDWAIKVYVDSKRPTRSVDAAVPAAFRLPATGERVPVDVEEIGLLAPQGGAIGGGSAVYNQRFDRNSAGSAACLMQERGRPGRLLLLTCAHVLAPGRDTQIGDVVMAEDSGGAQRQIGKLLAWTTFGQNDNATIACDAALVELTDPTVLSEIPEIGTPGPATGRVDRGDEVKLYSRVAKKLIHFTVNDTDFRVPDSLPEASADLPFRYVDAVSCTPRDAGLLTGKGDSGSAVLTADNWVAGLHFIGSSHRAVFCKIKRVLDFFENGIIPLSLEVVSFPALRAAPPPAGAGQPVQPPVTPAAAPASIIVPVESPDSAITTLAKTMWGEARGETDKGRIAVAWVVVNRTRRQVSRWGMTVEKVCRQPMQFSCWNPDDPNLAKIENLSSTDPEYGQCRAIAASVLKGEIGDPTTGSTHYHHTAITPFWVRGKNPVITIGNHAFYDKTD